MTTERNYWQRMRRQRLSRRALLRSSARAGVGAAGLALVGCGDDDDDAQQQAAVTSTPPQQDQPQAQQPAQQQQAEPQAEQQAQQADQQDAPADEQQQQQQVGQQAAPQRQYGGNYAIYTPPNWDGFDPHKTDLAHPFQVFNDSLGRLVQIYDNQGPVYAPDIASLPEVPDGETYIFRFDQGAHFWDRYPTEGGRLFDADDAALNITRQIDALDSEGIPDARFKRNGLYATTASVDVTDLQTLVLKTDGPDATYLESVHMGYSFLTSREAIALWDAKWPEETTNVELISGCGPFIPTVFEPELRLHLERNPSYWKSLDGQQMPFLDSITWVIMEDQTAVEAAYRTGQLDTVSLNALAVEGIAEDFPQHVRFERAVVLPLAMRFNYNTEWDENPWLDRRVPYAFHLGMDRDSTIDFVYLGYGKPSAIQHINWYHGWSIPDDEMRQLPGYSPVKDDDNAMARQLLDAAAVEPGTEFTLVVADIFEGLYQGASELYQNMFRDALGIEPKIRLDPYDAIFAQANEGTFPGHMPIWVGAGTGDPTGEWNNRLVFGASQNTERYNFPPVEEIVKRMRVTLDPEARREMAMEVSYILLGEDDRYGLDGFTPFSVMGNGIDTSIHWPYLNAPDISKNVWEREGWHWRKEVWFDTSHPDYPGERA